MLPHNLPTYVEGSSPSSLAHLARMVSCILYTKTSLCEADEGAVRPKRARTPTCSSALVPACLLSGRHCSRSSQTISKGTCALDAQALARCAQLGHLLSATGRQPCQGLSPAESTAARTLKLPGSVISVCGRLSQCPQLYWQQPTASLESELCSSLSADRSALPRSAPWACAAQ